MEKIVKVSNREAQILSLMGDGLTSKEIGRRLYISNLTVDKHKKNMLLKFGARNAVQMILKASKQGVIPNYA